MNKTELEQKINEVLPDGWELQRLVLNDPNDPNEKYAGYFKVTCPIEERFCDDIKVFHAKTGKIADAVNAIYDGGGTGIGKNASNRYDNFFFLRKTNEQN